ncbi:MAG TPA: polysaccharide deacetylase family protein [Nocardioides sp.]|nr:polysaccharide deacetylase family protein [Nocardioides sp.]
MLARFRVHALLASVALLVLLVATLFGGTSGSSNGPVAAARAVAADVGASSDPTAAASPDQPSDGPRCRGLVALTFDDGPAPGTTEHLVRLLQHLGVRATFFMVGQRVAAARRTVRTVADAGFAIGNHTWAHHDLSLQSAADARVALLRTQRALRRAGVSTGRLMRPPYGALDDTARHVIRGLGLVPVLWTVDSRDWQSGSSATIAHRILAALRPGPDNVVLQHDGVDRSPISVRAVSVVVRTARRRGYCFVELNQNGRPAWPAGYHTSQGARGIAFSRRR